MSCHNRPSNSQGKVKVIIKVFTGPRFFKSKIVVLRDGVANLILNPPPLSRLGTCSNPRGAQILTQIDKHSTIDAYLCCDCTKPLELMRLRKYVSRSARSITSLLTTDFDTDGSQFRRKLCSFEWRESHSKHAGRPVVGYAWIFSNHINSRTFTIPTELSPQSPIRTVISTSDQINAFR
ncbi:hypothetical protein EWB00_005843 [Schistosoma japonicum]|uniref:Uncharacterized protein n=1 Tax=Schistosoma japonicum TaxID=6182 RepID=A0A4Z2D0Q8_SCHJA|nr:hypothetical protein EWB00_005843 [Schistosoma japonicum]